MNKRYWRKRIVFIAIMIVMVCIYLIAFINESIHTRKTKVKYYNMGEKLVYGGVEYEFEAEKYTVNQLIDKFDLETERKKIEQIDKEISAMYIVTKVHAEKVEVCTDADKVRNNAVVLNKYMDASGTDYEILDLIQKKEYKDVSELGSGEETEYYILNVISKNDYCKEVWKHIDEAVFYFEFPDYKSNEYITRIKIIDGNYGGF